MCYPVVKETKKQTAKMWYRFSVIEALLAYTQSKFSLDACLLCTDNLFKMTKRKNTTVP